MKLRVGQTLNSTVDAAKFAVVRAGSGEVVLSYGGIDLGDGTPLADEGSEGAAVLLGKRYVDEDGTVELLCTKAGTRPLRMNGVELMIKQAKPLPASD